MADNDSPGTNDTHIDTGGGAHVDGSVSTGGGTFVGRDYVTNVTIQVSGEQLQGLADTLFRLLAAPDVRMRAGTVTAGSRAQEVSPELADALRQFLDARPGQTQAERARQYLLHLCVNPQFHQWQQRYVALSGGYRMLPELTPAFSAIRVLGEGPPAPDRARAPARHPHGPGPASRLHPVGPTGRGQDHRAPTHRPGQGAGLSPSRASLASRARAPLCAAGFATGRRISPGLPGAHVAGSHARRQR